MSMRSRSLHTSIWPQYRWLKKSVLRHFTHFPIPSVMGPNLSSDTRLYSNAQVKIIDVAFSNTKKGGKTKGNSGKKGNSTLELDTIRICDTLRNAPTDTIGNHLQ